MSAVLEKPPVPAHAHSGLKYAWDEDNRLTSASLNDVVQVSYTYDAAGRMLTRIEYSGGDPGTPAFFEWDGWDMVKETAPDGMVTRYFCPQSQLHSFQRGEDLFYVHSDALGSIRVITDAFGEAVSHFELDAWGNTLASSSDGVPGAVSYGFVGSIGVRFDPITGLHYMRQRWYAGPLGRFLTKDLLLSSNRYLYSTNSPTDYIDPTGLEEVPSNFPAPPGPNVLDAGAVFPNSGPYNNPGPTPYRNVLNASYNQHAPSVYSQTYDSESTGSWRPLAGPVDPYDALVPRGDSEDPTDDRLPPGAYSPTCGFYTGPYSGPYYQQTPGRPPNPGPVQPPKTGKLGTGLNGSSSSSGPNGALAFGTGPNGVVPKPGPSGAPSFGTGRNGVTLQSGPNGAPSFGAGPNGISIRISP